MELLVVLYKDGVLECVPHVAYWFWRPPSLRERDQNLATVPKLEKVAADAAAVALLLNTDRDDGRACESVGRNLELRNKVGGCGTVGNGDWAELGDDPFLLFRCAGQNAAKRQGRIRAGRDHGCHGIRTTDCWQLILYSFLNERIVANSLSDAPSIASGRHTHSAIEYRPTAASGTKCSLAPFCAVRFAVRRADLHELRLSSNLLGNVGVHLRPKAAWVGKLCRILANRKSFLLALVATPARRGRYPFRSESRLVWRLRQPTSDSARYPASGSSQRRQEVHDNPHLQKQSEIFCGHMAWHRDLEGQSVSHAFRIRVQFRLTSDQSLQRTSVYRQPRDRAAPEPRSVRPSACQFFVLCCMFE
jgi:hypothetical protein